MKLNHFELRLQQNHIPENTDFQRDSHGVLHLISEIWIDGQLLDEPHPVSVNAVMQSFEKLGTRSWAGNWHFVFTCGCGTAACANIDEGVGAVQGEDSVEWVFRRPQANRFGSDPLGYRQWCEIAQWHHYRFDRHQVIRELIRFLDEVWLVLNTSEIEVASKSDVLNWFHDDPRYTMRYRAKDFLSPDGQ